MKATGKLTLSTAVIAAEENGLKDNAGFWW